MITVSDSQPIQFWKFSTSTLISDNELITFNETDVYGLAKQDCFCQPLNATDEVTIQYYGGENGKIWIREYYPDGTTGYNSAYPAFTLVTPYIHQATPTLCDYFPNASWSDIGSKAFDTLNATTAGVNQSPGDSSIGRWTLPLNIKSGITVQFDITVNAVFFNPGDSVQVYFQIGNGTTFATSNVLTYTYPSSVGTTTISMVTSVDSSQIKIIVMAVSGSPITTVTMPTTMIWPQGPISLEIRDTGSDILMAKSDCLDIKSSHPETKQIEYTNATNFDNLYFENGSPGPYFYLRVPAMFHEEKNPQEQEDLELSNGQIVTLRSSIQEKRLFETGYMPNYMHKKLQKVLMHDTILIDGDYWKKRDSYDDSPIKKYNLKRASVFLTKYNSVEKNTI